MRYLHAFTNLKQHNNNEWISNSVAINICIVYIHLIHENEQRDNLQKTVHQSIQTPGPPLPSTSMPSCSNASVWNLNVRDCGWERVIKTSERVIKTRVGVPQRARKRTNEHVQE